MKQIQTEQSDNNSVFSSMVLTNRIGGNNVGLAVTLSFQKALGLSGTPEVIPQRSEEKQLLNAQILACNRPGFKSWFRIL